VATTRPFLVIPAIDLRDGRVVRLEQGDFTRETAYSHEPVAVAGAFVAAGARRLHVVDLDGAASGEPRHLKILGALVSAAGPDTEVEAAGGIRTVTSAAAALDAGAARVVFGTVAIRDPAVARETVSRFGADRVAIAVDVRDGLAVGDGWRPGSSGARPDELIRSLADDGVTCFEVTAIDRDGLLGGPDVRLLADLVALGRGEIIASGGIRDVDDARAVRDLGCAGAIVGRALYDASFDLGAAIEALSIPGA
jgi:phosphoribosylformimino-5-aminoimidazole carboxamide ribotide isomerase